MNINYTVKIASPDDIEKYYDTRIKNESDNEYLPHQKQKRLHSAKSKTAVFFYGYLDGEMICQASAAVSTKDPYVQNKEHIMSEKCAYLFNFLTEKKYRGKGYFSKLYSYMENALREMGFEHLSLGVEPEDTENKERYKAYGFTELLYEGYEEFDGMRIDVEYYRKSLK
ncbi:MAG: GNAT family N-acetyltransferase [Clostridia bacterium]|nr:GNAT family N-acetyltransferase [Clostridia bacterium]